MIGIILFSLLVINFSPVDVEGGTLIPTSPTNWRKNDDIAELHRMLLDSDDDIDPDINSLPSIIPAPKPEKFRRQISWFRKNLLDDKFNSGEKEEVRRQHLLHHHHHHHDIPFFRKELHENQDNIADEADDKRKGIMPIIIPHHPHHLGPFWRRNYWEEEDDELDNGRKQLIVRSPHPYYPYPYPYPYPHW